MDYEQIENQRKKAIAGLKIILPHLDIDATCFYRFLALAKELSAAGHSHSQIADAARDVCHAELSFESETYLEKELLHIQKLMKEASETEPYRIRKGTAKFIDQARLRTHAGAPDNEQ